MSFVKNRGISIFGSVESWVYFSMMVDLKCDIVEVEAETVVCNTHVDQFFFIWEDCLRVKRMNTDSMNLRER